ncbi:MAG TPA: uroporphyrinogen decarboxylase family protein [Candidatus Paceibacterota bacterium]|nr:methyltransferase [Verrucomicrobiota bacterium]HOX03218.1 uroporphyrinogen decarboxylase family protein [Verrucomicrobiota bacterium]HRZ46142.1 uroporphyrinogen decarboxylase family protein [Candidatus Paceibacterota bacterium]HRZ92931.1 uroporphyrinogen decarboxylase family protein [Candidatus Paceibacterota bacterium]
MNSRERLIATLNHEEPDRLCVDFGAGYQTGMGAGAVHRLRQAVLGDVRHRVKVIEPYQMLGEIDDALIEALGLDVVGVHGSRTMFGFRNEGWKPFELLDGTPALVPEGFNVTPSEDGGWLIYPEGDTSVPPSARMPRGSYFFDSICRQESLDESNLDPADNCEEFGVIDGEETQHFARWARRCAEETARGVYITLPGTAFGDIALVPAPWMKRPRGIRGVAEWYMATVTARDYVRAVFERQLESALGNVERLAAAVGDRAQVAFVSGTDFGTQTSQFCSVRTYRDLYKPFHKAVNDRIHALTRWKTFMHSCGAILPLIPEFIDAGFDILNPVQCSAAGMEPRLLKREFGGQIVFWGGGVDTQKTLPFGTPDEVYREVRERIEIFAPGGGYVFNSTHNVQSNVPVENLLAMFRAVDDGRSRGG